jgi:hypothetical protein
MFTAITGVIESVVFLPAGTGAYQGLLHAAVEIVFDGRSQTEHLAGSRIEQDRKVRTRDAISGHARAVLVPVNTFHDKYPMTSRVVLGGQVDEQSGAGAGMAAESLGRTEDARIPNIHAPSKVRGF